VGYILGGARLRATLTIMAHQMAPAIVKEIKAIPGNDVRREAVVSASIVRKFPFLRRRMLCSRSHRLITFVTAFYSAGLRGLLSTKSTVGIHYFWHALLSRVLWAGSRNPVIFASVLLMGSQYQCRFLLLIACPALLLSLCS